MANLKYGLGGRLPLFEPANLQANQRELYEKITLGIVPLANAAGFASKDEQGRLIGPFNATLYSPEMDGSFLALQKMEEEQTTLSKRTRQVVILTVGSVWKAPYELYAHSAVAAKVGLSVQQIEALAARGTPPTVSAKKSLPHSDSREICTDCAQSAPASPDHGARRWQNQRQGPFQAR